jgi:hypothetical protein
MGSLSCKFPNPVYDNGRVLRVRPAEYYLEVTEEVPAGSHGCPQITLLTYVLSPSGKYIGAKEDVDGKIATLGITKFYLRTRTSKVCTVGYSPRAHRWYGWSHRGIAGFRTRKAANNFARSVA